MAWGGLTDTQRRPLDVTTLLLLYKVTVSLFFFSAKPLNRNSAISFTRVIIIGLLESGQVKKSGRLNPPLPPLSSRSNFRETNPNREEWREVKWVARPLRQFDVPTRLIQNSAIALPESVILQLMSDIVSCPKFHHPGIEVGRKV
jgi:hypothetical protein